MSLTRRKFLIATAAVPVLAACRDSTVKSTATTLAPTPTCTDGDDPTPELTEGPYFKSGSPERSNLAADVSKGTKLTITGAVLTTDCKTVDRAKIEIWQADADGAYDNSGYTLRGHFFTDSQGRYSFTTVVPGIYPGRTRHIHCMAQKPNGTVLTSQLYFPGDASANANDNIYRKECLLQNYEESSAGTTATFNFVVR